MFNAERKPWSDNPNAPKIPYRLYFAEKSDFAGLLIAGAFYGMTIILFFQCMTTLLNPINSRRGDIKWGLVCYTVAMFSCATVVIGTAENIASITFIDNREYPGVEGLFPPGPIGYMAAACSGTLGIGPVLGAFLGYLLADGLLLHRCYITYGKNIWVITFPCLLYLTAMATGILMLASKSCGWGNVNFILLNLSISVSLNVILTLMIVTRLVLHSRNIRTITGSRAVISRLYKTVATMLIESSALYSVNSLVLIGLWAARSGAAGIFLPVFSQTQVIAALLIIQRVANRSALTSDTIVTGNIRSFRIGDRRESTGGDRARTVMYPMSSAGNYGKNTSELGIVVETEISLHHDDGA